MQIHIKQVVFNDYTKNRPNTVLCVVVISNYDLTLFEKRQTEYEPIWVVA